MTLDNGTDGQTDGQTDRQTDRWTDRVRRNMRPPPREEGRIINAKTPSLLISLLWLASQEHSPRAQQLHAHRRSQD